MKTDLTIAAYIMHEDKVLLVHHRKLDWWLPVGGHIEENETPDDALLREVKEETGLNVEILNKTQMSSEGNVKANLATPFHVNVHSVGDHDHCCFFYVCKALNAEEIRINKELKNFQWLTKEELNQEHIPVDVKHLALKAFEVAD